MNDIEIPNTIVRTSRLSDSLSQTTLGMTRLGCSDILWQRFQLELTHSPSSWLIQPPSISSFDVQTTQTVIHHGTLIKESSTFSISIFSPAPHSRQRMPHKRLTSYSRSIAQERKMKRSKNWDFSLGDVESRHLCS